MWLWLAGRPPSVINQRTLRLLKVQTMPSTMAGTRTGFRSGRVIDRNFVQAGAPSMSAASYISLGID